MGKKPEEICEFYKEYAKKIFPWWCNLLFPAGLFHNKYSNKELRNALHIFFQDSIISDCKAAVCIPVVDICNSQLMVFKTNNNGTQIRDLTAKLTDIALATSAAPSFFPIYSFDDYRGLMDGGLWQNNPALCGVIEACNCFVGPDKDYDVIHVMSIGNPLSGVRQSVSPWTKSSGIIRLREKLVLMPMKISTIGTHQILTFLSRTHALSIEKYLRLESKNLPTNFKNLKLDSSSDSAIKKMLERSNIDFNNNKHDIRLFFKEEN